MVRLWILLSFVLPVAWAADFQREIRPILSDQCFQCHGPDATTRMAGLRLDRQDDALAPRSSGGAPIVPGKPQASLIYQRISAADAARRMPPEYSHKKLTLQQVELIRQWIEQGAPWKEHWAFQAPVKPAPPQVRNTAWTRNPIDRFVLARLEKEGLAPAPEADRHTLLRRVALNLTGLPPKPAEIEAFLQDTAPGAYERMVDRYLASPHYGEHRARFWLDAARYGDTHGIHHDNYREIWPYRDWVIQAFNRNLSFDRFTIEQLAGDLLPNPTLDQKIATGFQRCNVTTAEAGIIEDEYAEIYAKDRADTVGAVWLGMTVGCATCHDHKFDPISQRDFYALGAFFRNTTQKVMDGNAADPPPVLLVPREEDRARWDQIQQRLRTVRQELSHAHGTAEAFAGKPVNKLDAAKAFSVVVRFELPDKSQAYTVASQQNAKERNRGWLLDVNADRQIGFRLTGDSVSTIEVRSIAALKPGPNHVTAVYDGSREQTGMALYVNGEPVDLQGLGTRTARLNGSIEVEEPATRGGRNLPETAVRDLRVVDGALTESDAWQAFRGLHLDAQYESLAAEQHKLNREAAEIAKKGSVTLIMEERAGEQPFAHILYRGAYDQRRDKVEAGTPRVLPPMNPSLPRNRLGFAQWLFTPEQPLTARVAVNRMWQEIFGTGLVKTADDFGSQGEPPVNQALLDWLAVDFRESGWDVKRFYRKLLTSAAFRQLAQATPEKLAADPENRLLSRGPRYRMDGEMVRDYALAAAGLLAPQIGGRSARPYQPEGVWEAVAMDGSNTRFYKQDAGEGLYRRSLYTFWKRSAPPASMDVFNAPSRETCTVRRERTDTPLQALVTMNDVQFVEAARVLASRAMESAAGTDARIDYVALRVLARPLSAAERPLVHRSLDVFSQHYAAHPEDARRLLNQGERKSDPGLPAAGLAALTMLTNQLLNLDEVLNQ